MKYTLKLSTLSDTLIGSALSYGTIIDSDIVFDAKGLPYIPAKRIKGLLRNAATDLLSTAGYQALFPMDERIVNAFFGKIGSNDPNPGMIFENLYLENYPEIDRWMDYLGDKYAYEINKPLLRQFFTEIRTQTAIDPQTNTAKEHSLRSSRVLKKGFEFSGEIFICDHSEDIQTLLGIACLLVDRIGSKRNRGFGKVKLDLLDQTGGSICRKLERKLEESCKN
ncbi:MAG: RAMP superfamily CRISPR-associated protein [Candidatus Cloacimonadaceae bacterium]|jgi:CRISPR-associated protein Csx10|nr:RAMP superfamily CRISPR-associated protein [Candidatus Cloacimonadota bacterium]MCB5255858.1 RAMP superfamily CRISPR-associated protein [Candidatus Cloacimonadota bacterium]MCK9242072.1 RAMP superfamily CRISPR-associated protein [Candidatus Cloacimonadota bacterium]MDD3534390.1 RAMP superfamily CRISPR-associated protein [Candidatus Cloacimonadota bacterium]MDY0128427.1 RAMP superfamily CRISPR-associated protein [Candidatus Cloacimonadaceae bacterium]